MADNRIAETVRLVLTEDRRHCFRETLIHVVLIATMQRFCFLFVFNCTARIYKVADGWVTEKQGPEVGRRDTHEFPECRRLKQEDSSSRSLWAT